MNKLITAVLTAVIVSAPPVFAKDGLKFGWAPSFSILSVDDPDGPTDTDSQADLLAGILAYPLQRDRRLLIEAGLIDFELAPSTDEIGQDVESIFLAANYQFRFRLTRNFKPWIGAGGLVSFDDFTQRVRVDSDGFLADRLSDRDDTSIGLTVLLSHEWELVPQKWEIGVNAGYLLTLSESIDGARVALTVFYK